MADAQRRAEVWCRDGAGMRIHRSTRCRPLEAFNTVEKPLLLPAPGAPYDVPIYSTPLVHRDHHAEVAKALYSVPGNLIGKALKARADRATVKLFLGGQLVKVHPRQPAGGRSTDPADLPSERTAYALRDLNHLIKVGHGHGRAIGRYVEAILDHPLPWTKMRQAYRLLGFVKKWGADRVDSACSRALEAEVVNANLIGRMIERALETEEVAGTPAAPVVVPGRFARNADEFATPKAQQR